MIYLKRWPKIGPVTVSSVILPLIYRVRISLADAHSFIRSLCLLNSILQSCRLESIPRLHPVLSLALFLSYGYGGITRDGTESITTSLAVHSMVAHRL